MTAADETIWQYAMETDAAIITKDEDFARRKIMESDGPPIIVWLRLPNTRRRELLAFVEAILPEMLEALDRGESLVEITRGLRR